MAERNTTIEDLPGTVLLHIISFLPTLDAIQTTVISPKFRNLWTSLPSLSFDFSLFLPPCDTPSETLRAFADFVSRALILRPHSDLRTLSLRLDSTTDHRRYRHHITSWIRYAVDHNADHLSLAFYPRSLRGYDAADMDTAYHFPFSALRDGAVRSLLLERCNLELPTTTSRAPFETLSSIFLEQIYLTDELLSDLVSRCSNLETLRIASCSGMKDVKISSSRLMELGIWHFMCDEGSVEICAPNLRKLSFRLVDVGNYVMEDSFALEEASVFCIDVGENYSYWSKMVRLLGHAKHLDVQNWWYKAVVAKDCLFESFLFYNLNYLKLQTQYTKADLLGIAILLQLSPNLETMILERGPRIDEEVFGGSMSEEFDRINFSLPSLRQLRLKWYWATRAEVYFLRLMLKSEVVLERIVLDPIRMDNISVPPPTLMVKRSHGFQVVQGSFPGYGLNAYQEV